MKKYLLMLFLVAVVFRSFSADQSLVGTCFTRMFSQPQLKQQFIETVGMQAYDDMFCRIYASRLKDLNQQNERKLLTPLIKAKIFDMQRRYCPHDLERLILSRVCVDCRRKTACNTVICDTAFAVDYDQLCEECAKGQLCAHCLCTIELECLEEVDVAPAMPSIVSILGFVYQDGQQLFIDYAHEIIKHRLQSDQLQADVVAKYLHRQGTLSLNRFISYIESLPGGVRYLQQIVSSAPEPWMVDIHKRLVHKELQELRPRRMMGAVIAQLAQQFEDV